MKLASDVMSSPVVTVGWMESLEEASRRMDVYRFSFLPVMGPGDKVVGVVTKTDVIHYMHAVGERRLVKAIMSPVALTCSPADDLCEVVRTMDANRIHHLVVLDDDRPVGIISALDILHAVVE